MFIKDILFIIIIIILLLFIIIEDILLWQVSDMWLNCWLGHNLSDHMTNTAFLALFHFTIMQSQSSQVLIWLVYNFVMLTVILLKPAKTDPRLQ